MPCATTPNGPSFLAIPHAGCAFTASSPQAFSQATFLGGVGFFFGPIIGAIVFTLVQTVLSLQTELWAFYAGMLFLATVRLGKLGVLAMPYVKTLIPAAIGILGLCALVEMTFHYRHAATGDHEMTLFWTTFDSHTLLPWIIAGIVTVVGIGIARRNAPELKEAWDEANSPGAAQ